MNNSGYSGEGIAEDRYTNMAYYDLLPPSLRAIVSTLNLNFATERIYRDFKSGQTIENIAYNIMLSDYLSSKQDMLDKYGIEHPSLY